MKSKVNDSKKGRKIGKFQRLRFYATYVYLSKCFGVRMLENLQQRLNS